MGDFAVDREYGWDDAIENDSEFEVLPEGDYNFRIIGFERGRHPGSDRLPPCNKAILTIEVFNGQKKTTVTHNLFLHSKCEGLLCEFFTAIGQRSHGERIVPNWNMVIGATGTCKLGIDTWTGRMGDKRQSNQIKRFYAKGANVNVGAPAAVPPQTSYTPGAF